MMGPLSDCGCQGRDRTGGGQAGGCDSGLRGGPCTRRAGVAALLGAGGRDRIIVCDTSSPVTGRASKGKGLDVAVLWLARPSEPFRDRKSPIEERFVTGS